MVEKTAQAAPSLEDWDDYVDPFRVVGFSYTATDFPRCETGIRAIAAWNNIPLDKVPTAWKFYPNASTKAAWERVYAACAALSQGAEGSGHQSSSEKSI